MQETQGQSLGWEDPLEKGMIDASFHVVCFYFINYQLCFSFINDLNLKVRFSQCIYSHQPGFKISIILYCQTIVHFLYINYA